jgi:hypothetical protein
MSPLSHISDLRMTPGVALNYIDKKNYAMSSRVKGAAKAMDLVGQVVTIKARTIDLGSILFRAKHHQVRGTARRCIGRTYTGATDVWGPGSVFNVGKAAVAHWEHAVRTRVPDITSSRMTYSLFDVSLRFASWESCCLGHCFGGRNRLRAVYEACSVLAQNS